MKEKTILIIFGKESPKKNKSWFDKFDKVLFSKELEDLITPGSVQEAYQLFCKLPKITDINYKGYQLWWVHHDDIYYQFCLPYTQYCKLLNYLKDFKEIHLYQPPFSSLFQYFLEANNCRCIIYKKRRFLPPFGILLQLFLSFLFLFWLKITKPKLLLETSDRFSGQDDFDFRYKFVYQELRERKISFVEFIRSLESWLIVLKHAWRRKRPVIYSAAIVGFVHYLAGLFGEKIFQPAGNPNEKFWFLASTHYLRNIRGTIWSIQAMKFIWQWVGAKSAIVPTAANRNFHEVLACKLAGIKTVGIQRGAIPKYYSITDFMPGFDGKNYLSVDKYGLWSEWWRNYFIKNSDAFKEEQLYVSGPLRPLEKEMSINEASHPADLLKVLFVSEGLAAFPEVMPYLLTLLETREFNMHIKFRPYRDGFELWLKEHQPEVYKNILEETRIFRGTMAEAINQCDIVVGSHSTAVLESLLQLKPFVFFQTQKWGDYYDLKSFDVQSCLLVENPIELINCIKKSPEISLEYLKQLRENFFGNPYQNGSKWEVDEAEKILSKNQE